VKGEKLKQQEQKEYLQEAHFKFGFEKPDFVSTNVQTMVEHTEMPTKNTENQKKMQKDNFDF